MRSKLFHLLTLASSLMLCQACAESLDPGDALLEPQPLVFTASQGGDLSLATRAAADGTWDGDGTEFVAIKIGSEVKKYKVTSSNALEPADNVTPFYRSDKSNIEITAWYPYQSELPTQPSIATDQSSKANREASNLMTASATAVFGETTSLAFTHQTARLNLSLVGEDGTTTVTDATVKFIINSTEITAFYDTNKMVYSALVSPTSIKTGEKFLLITTSTGTYEAKSTSDITLAAGQSYKFEYGLKYIPYVTFTAEGEQKFKMQRTKDEIVDAKISTFEYSVGGGTWETVELGTEVTFGGSHGNLRLRGTGLNADGEKALYGTSVKKVISEYQTSYVSSNISFMNPDVPVAASGDIRTLIAYENYDEVKTSEARFYKLFIDCKVLTSAPYLVATDLADYCYSYMFSGCTELRTAPELKAAMLAQSCYQGMFNGCTNLTTAPELKTTTLANYCYANMFQGCTGLTKAPKLEATTLARWCYQGMFSGCTGLTVAPELSVTELAVGCYQGMFQGCTGLTAAPKLEATTLAQSCYQGMFSGCTGFTAAPKLEATTLAQSCYKEMFSGCTRLTEAPALEVTTLEKYCYQGMFSGCTGLTAAPELKATTLAQSCYQGMFSGCTGLTAAPKLEATTLAQYCYRAMFSGCTGLTEAPKLGATRLADYCYCEMFSECSALENAPELSGTTLAPFCYSKMFMNCTKLTNAPNLQVVNLGNNCYQYMFSGCISLEKAPELPATQLKSKCYYYMFDGCTNLKSVTIKATDFVNYALDCWLPAFEEGESRIIYYSDDATKTMLTEKSAIPSGWIAQKSDN